MPTGLASNKAARDAVLGRVKKALGATGDRAAANAEADASEGSPPPPSVGTSRATPAAAIG